MIFLSKSLLLTITVVIAISVMFSQITTASETPVVDKIALAECLSAKTFYLPFYLNNNDAALKASTPYSISENIPLEASINAQTLVTQSCFDCDQAMELLSNERNEIIFNNRECETDADCAMNWSNTSLRGGCQYPSNQRGAPLLEEWTKKWDDWFTASGQLETYRRQCGYMTPMCMIQLPECFENKCWSGDGSIVATRYSAVDNALVSDYHD